MKASSVFFPKPQKMSNWVRHNDGQN